MTMRLLSGIERPASRSSVAYFSMEIAADHALPTYSGGLGVLAGDHLRAAADLAVPIVGVTLLYRGGYFEQSLTHEGQQRERAVEWTPAALLEPIDERIDIELDGRTVTIGAWCHWVNGCGGFRVPVIFLDTDVPENDEQARAITDQLYAGDQTHRLRQEAVLGLGGVALLERLGLDETRIFHMNEGHSSLLVLALFRMAIRNGYEDPTSAVCRRCVFTTHTPVPEGHDHFDAELVKEVLGADVVKELDAMGVLTGGELNMTVLGMSFSSFINAVSLLHGQVSRPMFPNFAISSITNGVHAGQWVAPSVAQLFDRYVPEWRRDNASLRSVSAIPADALDEAHRAAKQALVDLVFQRCGSRFDPAAFTLGIARRAARYKRLDLLLSDPVRLREIAAHVGPLQVVYGGKAHPMDEGGKAVIAGIHQTAEVLKNDIRIVYLENYAMDTAAVLCAGADVWVNTPIRGMEASGTSGMKAALNGVPSLSVLDGWWPEAHVEGVTGWSIGGGRPSDDASEAEDIYEKLGAVVASLFYGDPNAFTEVRRGAIALNGSYFTAERMVRQYATRAYGID